MKRRVFKVDFMGSVPEGPFMTEHIFEHVTQKSDINIKTLGKNWKAIRTGFNSYIYEHTSGARVVKVVSMYCGDNGRSDWRVYGNGFQGEHVLTAADVKKLVGDT